VALVSVGTVGLAPPASADTSSCPCTLWSDAEGPSTVDSGDGAAVELGMGFTVDEAVSVTGLRFYKAAANTGTHIGSLWSADGTLLARATFSAETASGWQTVSLAPAVTVQPGTRYVASYHAPAGHYSFDGGYFSAAGRDRSPLHASGGDPAAPNGLFVYSPVPAFPTGTFNGNNYWVDVVVGSAAPTLTGISVSPVGGPLTVGKSGPLTATGSYADGTSRDVTGEATWSSSAPAVVSVSSSGTISAVGAGTAVITATVGPVSGSTTISVRKVTGLVVGGAPASLAKGLSRTLTATATYSDGTSAVVPATWSSSRPPVAEVSATGVLSAAGIGSATVTASYGGVSASVPVTVTAAAMTGLTVQPNAATAGLLGTLQLKATATYTDGTTVDVTNRARWTTSNPFVVVVSTYLLPGRFLALLPGTATVTATVDGMKASTVITVRW
jgi:uncharacterized protein YjdB